MGGSVAGNFGRTIGSALDAVSNVLAAASLIPGVDTFVDIAAIPVDIARGDWVSAGLDTVGVIPFIGEAADTARLAKKADKAIDAAKAAKKVTAKAKTAKIPKLSKTPSKLLKDGWKETTPASMKRNTSSRMFTKDGYTIRFDKGRKGANGYGGKDHYHILNPNSTGKHDYYLDELGNPTPKNSKKSHIIP